VTASEALPRLRLTSAQCAGNSGKVVTVPPNDPGFDVSAVQDALLAWLVTNGFAEAGVDASDAAMSHIELHAMQRTPADAEPSREVLTKPCALVPCRALGVALALWEITTYRLDLGRDLVALIRAVDTLRQELARVESLSVSNMLEPARREYARLNVFKRATPGLVDADYFDMVCRAPVEILLGITSTRSRAESLLEVLQTYVDSSAADGARPGRPSQALLAGVTQHLYANDFTYGEIANMVSDGTAGDAEAAWQRVRKRAKGPDQRRLMLHAPPEAGGNKPG